MQQNGKNSANPQQKQSTVGADAHIRPQPKQQKQPAKRGRPRKQKLEPVKVTFLGGLNEVGKNLTVYEFRGDRIIVDCGLAFPDAETPGIDLIIPDYAWLE